MGVDKVVVVVEEGEREDGSGGIDSGLNIDDAVDDVCPWLHDEHVYFPFWEMLRT